MVAMVATARVSGRDYRGKYDGMMCFVGGLSIHVSQIPSEVSAACIADALAVAVRRLCACDLVVVPLLVDVGVTRVSAVAARVALHVPLDDIDLLDVLSP